MLQFDLQTLTMLGCIAGGSLIFWVLKGRSAIRPKGIAEILDTFEIGERKILLLEVTAFVFLGCIIGQILVSPTTPMQAITTGFGWTGLFAKELATNAS